MKEIPTVSIIIPAYNAERYLPLMLDSVISQSYSALDIILVNDGSTDDTRTICLSYAEKDKRVRYYEQENSGPSTARNLGIKHTKGEYILFADADDQLGKDAIGKFVNCADKTGADIVVGCFGGLGEEAGYAVSGKKEAASAALCGNQYLGGNIEEHFKPYINMGATCGKLIKKELIVENNIFFPEDITHREDLIFFLQAYACSAKIIILYASVYIYRQVNENSLVRRFNSRKIEETYKVIDRIEKYQKELFPLEDKIVYEFVMHTIYTGWHAYYTHERNRSSVQTLYRELRENLSDAQVRSYLYDRTKKLNDSFSVFQKTILKCMQSRCWPLLTVLAYAERKFRTVQRSCHGDNMEVYKKIFQKHDK